MIYGDPISLGGGGSGGDVFAFIVADYPAGSVCTASSGSTTLTAGDTSGSWVFKIPAAGTWTVKSTDGVYTASESVSISSEGESTSVRLAYIPDGAVYWLGNEFTSKTGGWASNGRGTYEVAKNADNIYMMADYVQGNHFGDAALYTESAVDLSGYSTLRCSLIDCVCSAAFSGTSEVGLYVTSTKTQAQSTAPPTSTLAKNSLVGAAIVMDGDYEFSVDISGISSGFLALQQHPRTNGQITWKAVKIWME